MDIATFNVNGAKSSAEEIAKLAQVCDVICLQEIKSKVMIEISGFTTFWTPSTYLSSYAGTAILARTTLVPQLVPVRLADPGFDDDDINTRRGHYDEGRITAIQCTIDKCPIVVLSVYSPNSGVDHKCPLKRLKYRTEAWDRDLSNAVLHIQATITSNIVLCGDLNVAVRAIDVHNPKTMTRKAGFTDEERHSFNCTLMSHLRDSWTCVNQTDENKDQADWYTFFGFYQKKSNKGWRLDYELFSGDIYPTEAIVLHDYSSSDHVPLWIRYRVL